MNLVTLLNNIFVISLFPNGIGKNTSFFFASMGSIFYAPHNSITLYVNVKEPPAVAVPKWGVWGEDYDTIKIKMAFRCLDFYANKEKNTSLSSFDLKNLGKHSEGFELYTLDIKEEGWNLSISFSEQGVLFLGCKALLNMEDYFNL